MMSQIFGLEPALQYLYYEDRKGNMPTPLEDDDQTLGYYGVPEEGATVFMADKAE